MNGRGLLAPGDIFFCINISKKIGLTLKLALKESAFNELAT
jgi:hypothetical protein